MAQPFELAGAADAINRRVEPKSEEDAWIAGVAAGDSFDCLDLLVENGQVEPFDELPDEPGGVIRVKPLIERFAVHLHLLAFGPIEPWGRPRAGGMGAGFVGSSGRIDLRKQHGLFFLRHESPSWV